MDQGTIKQLFALLRSAICGTKLNESECRVFFDERFLEMISVAKKHDVLHLVELGLKQNSLVPDSSVVTDDSVLKAIYRYEQSKYETDILCEALESAEIPFILLKGAVMSRCYPEEWMRTSCDIDVLVHKEDSEKAVSLLIDNYGYVFHKRGSHDISLYTPNQKHIELHFNLVEDGVANESSAVLDKVWDTAYICENRRYRYAMPDDMFYFYHIAHMAKHFENGGCGIRPFIDLWILDNVSDADFLKRDELLEQGNLLKFAKASRRLSRIWFEGAEADEVSLQMEQFVLKGGVYGSKENKIVVQQQKKGGRINYALSRIFVSYDELVLHYPIVKKHRWLMPVMQMRRWCKLIFCGHLARVTDELKYNRTVSADKAEYINILLNSIGL